MMHDHPPYWRFLSRFFRGYSRDSGCDAVRSNWTWVQLDLAIQALNNLFTSPKKETSMPSLIPDVAAFKRRLAGLPVVKHPAHEVVLTAGSKTGRLLFLKSGAVEVIKDGVQIANVSAPGSVFGDQAVLLDQPHTADVRTVEQSEFYVADAPAMFVGDPTVALYVATILARRIDTANRSLIEVKHQLKAGEPPNAIGRTVEK